MKLLGLILAFVYFYNVLTADKKVIWKESRPFEKNGEIIAYEREWDHAGFVSCRVAVTRSRLILVEARTHSDRIIPSFRAVVHPNGRVVMTSWVVESTLVLNPILEVDGKYHPRLVEDKMLILACLRPSPSEGFEDLRDKILSVHGFMEL